MSIKTVTGSSGANAAQTVSITSPGTKCIQFWGYVVTFYGGAPTEPIQIDFSDSGPLGGEVIWIDLIPAAIATKVMSSPARFVFPKPYFVRKGLDLQCDITAGGAGVITKCSLLYEI